jgi:ParB family chromosome partitioning protein
LGFRFFISGKQNPMEIDQISQIVPIRRIVRGFNYRRRFNQAKMDELVEDVKRQGILQDILVRKLDDGNFQIIAGNRRLKAVELAFGEDATIPAKIRAMTDAEAMAAMVSENKVREDTSAIEDAEAATRMLGLLNGDREETAKRLGWSPHILNARLGIMNATDKVRDAFIDEKILLGHVEILAALIKDVQDGVLEKMLARPKVPTVAELKAMAEQILLNLDAAIFDKGECGGCHYNTGKQQAMFETSFEGTRCTNRGCYEKKTEAELEKRRQALTGDYQVVRIVRPGDNMTVVPLRAAGAKGVGDGQALACRTCGDFGACISAAPDKLGMSFKDVCFNSTCNAEKVDARVKAEQEAEAAARAPETAGATGSADAKGATPAPKGTGGTKQAKAPTKAASSEPRNAVKEYRESVWRKVYQRAVLRLPVAQSRALLIALCLHSPRTLSHSDATTAVGKVIGNDDLSSLEAGDLLGSLLKLDQKGLGDSLQQIPAFVGSELSIKVIAEMMTALDIKIEHHWKVNEAFFDLLTKTEVDAVCIELGLDKAIGKEYPKLKGGGKADYIKAILAIEGYDYVGKIPALMRW